MSGKSKGRSRAPYRKKTEGAFGGRRWTENDVEDVIANPVYVGVGPFPKAIADEVWITTAVLAIRKYGTETFLSAMLAALRKSFGDWEKLHGGASK